MDAPHALPESGRAPLEHVNAVLISLRELQRTLISEHDPRTLLTEACIALVGADMYEWATAVLVDAATGVALAEASASAPGDPRTIPDRPAIERAFGPGDASATFRDADGGAIFAARILHHDHDWGVLAVGMTAEQIVSGDDAQLVMDTASELGFALTAHDLADRKHAAEAQLAAAERRWRAYFDLAPLAIVVTNRSGDVLAANQRARAWFGYIPDRSRLVEAVIGSDEVRVEAHLAVILETSPRPDAVGDANRIDARMGPNAEGARWCSLTAQRLDDGSVLWMISDETERHQAEQRAEQALETVYTLAQRHRVLFEFAPDARLVVQAEGTIEAANPAAARLFGVPDRRDLEGRSMVEFWVDPDRRVDLLRSLERDGRVEAYHAEHIRDDGSTFVGAITAALVPDPVSGERMIHGSILDESERLRNERLVIERSEELSETNLRLREAQRELVAKEKLASIGQLAAGVAHEVNNPLGFVQSNFKMVERYVESVTNVAAEIGRIAPADSPIRALLASSGTEEALADMKDIVAETHEGLERMAAIVRSLKDFARASEDELIPEFDLNEAVRSSLTIARNEYRYVADVEFHAADLPGIQCNANEINQVLLNLLVNAAHAVREAEREQGHISIETGFDARWVWCRVTDNGPGVPPENRDRIFEPFFTTKPAGVGTGLGLSISFDIIVNRHGGELRVEPAKPHGASFVVRLPRPTDNGSDGR